MSLPAEQQDRAAGALLGLALGDALGAGYEFGPPVDPAIVDMVGGGPIGWEPGEWTDDTEMAICIGRVAVVTPDLDHPAVLASIGDAFRDWAAKARDVGVQTRAVLSKARSGAELPTLARAYFDGGNNAAGNGSLMRTAPVALAYLGDDAALAEVPMLVSALTHGDPLARKPACSGVRGSTAPCAPGARTVFATASTFCHRPNGPSGATCSSRPSTRARPTFLVTAMWCARCRRRGRR